jgi:hypothetical protein
MLEICAKMYRTRRLPRSTWQFHGSVHRSAAASGISRHGLCGRSAGSEFEASNVSTMKISVNNSSETYLAGGASAAFEAFTLKLVFNACPLDTPLSFGWLNLQLAPYKHCPVLM